MGTINFNTVQRRFSLFFALLLLAFSSHAELLPDDKLIAEGQWQKKSFAVQGTWRLVESDGQLHVVLGKDFSTKNAPDLKIFLSRQSSAALNGDNATQQAVLAGQLETQDDSFFGKKMKGAQRLSLPAGSQAADFKSIILHCEEYAKLWAVAALNLAK